MNSLPVQNVEDSWSELPGLEIEANDLVSAPLVQPGGESMGSLKPSWYYEGIDNTESTQSSQGPMAMCEEGVCQYAPQAARQQPHKFHTYSGMNACNAHVASKASVLLTAFDCNNPIPLRKHYLVKIERNGTKQSITNRRTSIAKRHGNLQKPLKILWLPMCFQIETGCGRKNPEIQSTFGSQRILTDTRHGLQVNLRLCRTNNIA